MKKLFITVIILFNLSILFAQYKTFKKDVFVKFKSFENKDSKLETILDSIEFKFDPDKENFWKIEIRNKCTQKISIVWENAVIGAGDGLSKVIFSTDTRISMKMPKSSEVIYPNAYISKEIDNFDNFQNENYTIKLFYVKYLKDGYEWPVRLILPIKKGDKEKDFQFDFLVYKAK